MDKQALFPGQTATIANSTGYSRGINGIMVDITGLANPGGLTLANIGNYFAFKVGPGSNPASWSPGPSPSNVQVRQGAGTDGSSRVTIIWLDDNIQNQWLEVTVLVTPQTGLAAPDVFYYGNLRGDANNDQAVDATDYALWFNNYGVGPVGDVTADGLVDASDYAEWFNNYGVALASISWGGGSAAASAPTPVATVQGAAGTSVATTASQPAAPTVLKSATAYQAAVSASSLAPAASVKPGGMKLAGPLSAQEVLSTARPRRWAPGVGRPKAPSAWSGELVDLLRLAEAMDSLAPASN
jgi:hypothetical protein